MSWSSFRRMSSISKCQGISEDARDLGLQLTSYSWQPVP